MAKSKRILFLAGEITPFVEVSDMAEVVYDLAEQLQDLGNYDVRIMMPKYGTISERKNRLHEVIRLSGEDVEVNGSTEALTVKVASIPEGSLQVYFMDNETYFGRDAIGRDDDGDSFDDNAWRSLFFNRAALNTVSKLRWGPDVVHAFGWVSSLAPFLLDTEQADNDLFSETKSFFTPSPGLDVNLPENFATKAGLPFNDADASLMDVGVRHAGTTLYLPDGTPASADALVFDDDAEKRAAQLAELYEQTLSEVVA